MIYHDVQQGTPEWVQLRLGVPTASNFDKIMTPAKMQLSKSADKLIATLIGDKLSPFLPERIETFTSKPMEWGQQTEEEARRYYEMEKGCTVQNGGFCLSDDGMIGCSPDGLIGEDGGLELKCPLPGTHVQYLLDGGLPEEYKCQVHGCLIVTGRSWWDFMSYSIGLPPFLIRVTPDAYTAKLKSVIYDEFLPRFDVLLKKVQG